LDTGNQEVAQKVGQAIRISDALWSLATEYQERIRTANDTSAAESHRLTKQKLDQLFRGLQPQPAIESLRALDLMEAAERLDDLWKSTAMVFNLVDVSVGVDQAEVLEIDMETPYRAARGLLAQADFNNWTREELVQQIRLTDNVGMSDAVDFQAMSDAELRDNYNEIQKYNAARLRAWNGGKSVEFKSATWPGLAWAMQKAGEPVAKIAKSLGLDMETVEWYLRA
jgi:hypothetical protein